MKTKSKVNGQAVGKTKPQYKLNRLIHRQTAGAIGIGTKNVQRPMRVFRLCEDSLEHIHRDK